MRVLFPISSCCLDYRRHARYSALQIRMLIWSFFSASFTRASFAFSRKKNYIFNEYFLFKKKLAFFAHTTCLSYNSTSLTSSATISSFKIELLVFDVSASTSQQQFKNHLILRGAQQEHFTPRTVGAWQMSRTRGHREHAVEGGSTLIPTMNCCACSPRGWATCGWNGPGDPRPRMCARNSVGYALRGNGTYVGERIEAMLRYQWRSWGRVVTILRFAAAVQARQQPLPSSRCLWD